MARTLFEINDRKRVAYETSEFEGEEWTSIRTWVRKRDGTWSRTRNGLSIPSAYLLELKLSLGRVEGGERRR